MLCYIETNTAGFLPRCTGDDCWSMTGLGLHCRRICAQSDHKANDLGNKPHCHVAKYANSSDWYNVPQSGTIKQELRLVPGSSMSATLRLNFLCLHRLFNLLICTSISLKP